jgi:hypothetical protein
MLFNLPIFNFTYCEATIDKGKVIIPEVLAQEFLGMLHAEAAMIGCVRKDYSDDLAVVGDEVTIPKLGALHTHEKMANTPVTLQDPSLSSVPVTLTNHKEVSFLIEDVAQGLGVKGVKEAYIRDAAKAIAENIDTALLGEYAEATEELEWDGSSVTTIAASIIAARSKIVVDNKCGNQPRYLVIRDMKDLLGVTGFESADYNDDQAQVYGRIGKLYGFEVIEDPLCLTGLSPSGQVHRLAFAKNAIALVTRNLGSPTSNGVSAGTVESDGIGCRVLRGYNMNFLGEQLTIDILYGVAVIEPLWLYELTEQP